jgi:hypothetical protein
LLPFFSPFGFNQLSLLEHLLFRLLTMGGNNYYNDWHIVGLGWFKCYRGIKTNRFSSKHVFYLNFSRALSLFMFYTITHYIRITNMFFFWLNKLGSSSCYRFRKFSGWHNSYLFFSNYDKFPLNNQFYHNWSKLMLILLSQQVLQVWPLLSQP